MAAVVSGGPIQGELHGSRLFREQQDEHRAATMTAKEDSWFGFVEKISKQG